MLEVVKKTELVLENLGYKTCQIPITRQQIDKFIGILKTKNIQLCFNFCESVEEKAAFQAHICGIMELLNISYTGTGLEGMTVTTNKILAKHLFTATGLSTPNFGVYDGKRIKDIVSLKLPVIVKPAYEDGSIGIEAQNIFTEISALMDFLPQYYSKFNQPILIEEFIEGREFTVSLLGYPTPKVLAIAEIRPHHGQIIDYQTKWQSHADYAFFPDLPLFLKKRIQKLALKAFEITKCRDYARVDMKLSKENNLYILEVNANPCLSPGSTLLEICL